MGLGTLEEMELAKGRQTNNIQKKEKRSRAEEGHLFQESRVKQSVAASVKYCRKVSEQEPQEESLGLVLRRHLSPISIENYLILESI